MAVALEARASPQQEPEELVIVKLEEDSWTPVSLAPRLPASASGSSSTGRRQGPTRPSASSGHSAVTG